MLATTVYPVLMGVVMEEVGEEVLVGLVKLEVMVGMVVRQEVAVVRLGLVLVQAQMGKAVTEQEEKSEYFHGRR